MRILIAGASGAIGRPLVRRVRTNQIAGACRRTIRSNAEGAAHDHDQRLHWARAGQSGREMGPARPVRDRGLPGPERRADTTYAARQVDPDLAGRWVARRHVDLGGVPGAAADRAHGRHPLRDQVEQARDRLGGGHHRRPVRGGGPRLMAHCDGGYTTNLPLEDLLGGKGLVATRFDGEPLAPEHGGPARLLVPHLYFWKSAKWVRRLRFMEHDEPGFWESLGYHIYGDPRREQRYDGD